MLQKRDPGSARRISITSSASHLLLRLCTLTLVFTLAYLEPSRAEVRVVTGIGDHRMSDGETKADAVRLATEQAKRQALEQVALYLESVTVVRDLDVTQDEIRSYTAGMVLVLDQQVKTELAGDVVTIRVELTAQLDTDEVAQAIAALKQNEDAREQLVALKEDVDQLQQELEAANEALAAATSREQIQQLSHERNELLNRAESDAMVAQAWTDWVLVAPFAQPYPSAGLAQIQALLGLAGRLSPNNPYLAIAQQTVGAHSPPGPPQPPQPPVPHTVPFLPGYYVVPAPAQPGTAPRANSRQLSSVYQLNPLLPNPSGQAPQPGSTTTIIQVPAQPGSSLPHPDRNTMPTYRQVPPPNGQVTPRTLHTYRSGGDRASSSAASPSGVAPRGIPPVIMYQAPQKPAAVPPPLQNAPEKGANQGGK
jgi:predicted component of type VI protein secretion system